MSTSVRLEGATPRQKEFIEKLLSERTYAGSIQVDSPSQASRLITELLRAPRKSVRDTVDTELFEALSAVQKSKYAIPTSEILLDFFDKTIDNDLLFVEVKEHLGKLQIRQLHGAVGDFTRTKLSRKDALVILRHIAQDTYKYARLFGEHFVCCGKCAAPLTDEKSRKLQLGPICQKAFGF